MASNVHLNVDPATWSDLLAQLCYWRDVSAAGVIRYALDELGSDLSYGDGVEPFPTGNLRLQAVARTPEDIATWAMLTEKYGTTAMATRVALAALLGNLLANPEEEEEETVSSVNGAIQGLST